MTIIEPIAVTGTDRQSPDDLRPDALTQISQPELVELVRQMRVRARQAGKRVPGRPTLARTIGVKPYQVRKAIEEIEMTELLARKHDVPRHVEEHTPPQNAATADAAANVVRATPARPTATLEPPTTMYHAAGDHVSRAATIPSERNSHMAPTGANAARPAAVRRARVHRDIAGSVVRAAVLISMFVLAAAVWVKAAELSGHQVELGTLPILNWPVRLAYFAPILVEGAVYAAIRICHTLDYVRDATRRYAHRTAAIGLLAMVVVGATVGLGFAGEPYARDAIGGLIGGLGPYMGWRTSKASAMVAGDRRAATENGPHVPDTVRARQGRLGGLLDTLATAATTRVTSWANKSRSGANTTAEAGASSDDHVAPGQPADKASKFEMAVDGGARTVNGRASASDLEETTPNESPKPRTGSHAQANSGQPPSRASGASRPSAVSSSPLHSEGGGGPARK